MLAVIKALWGVLVSCVTWVLGPILRLSNPHHDVPYASPSRVPPDPSVFPYYIQNKQGIWLKWTEWYPRKGETRGVVFVCSGLGEHAARYDSVAKPLVAEGLHCFAMDHQGQGLSEGDRCYVERFADYVDDYCLFVRRTLTSYPELNGLPCFLLGHSMGGLMAILIAYRDPSAWKGVILSAPALEPDPNVATPLMRKLATIMSNVFPKLGLDKLDVRKISNNPAIVQAAMQDPAYGREKMQARWGYEMLQAMDQVWVGLHLSTFPLLMLHGREDTLCIISGSRKFVQAANTSDKQLVEFDRMSHEVLTELNCGIVLAEVIKFIRDRMLK